MLFMDSPNQGAGQKESAQSDQRVLRKCPKCSLIKLSDMDWVLGLSTHKGFQEVNYFQLWRGTEEKCFDGKKFVSTVLIF